MTPGLGRRFSPDDRDKAFRLREALPSGTVPTYNYWFEGWAGDQGSTSCCTAYSAMHWFTASPKPHTAPFMDPKAFYCEELLVDEWADNDRDCGTYATGTSVRAGCKTLVAHAEALTGYRWVLPDESDAVDVIVTALLTQSPVMLGVNWYSGFDSPTATGDVKISGSIRGGHAFTLTGVSTKYRRVRAKNSWGTSWGHNGHFRFSFDDLARLVHEDGEAAVCIEA